MRGIFFLLFCDMVFVYVLANEMNSELYVGISINIQTRLKQHNLGTNRYTKAFLPWKVVYQEDYPDYASARVREKYLKSAAGKKFIKKQLGSP